MWHLCTFQEQLTVYLSPLFSPFLCTCIQLGKPKTNSTFGLGLECGKTIDFVELYKNSYFFLPDMKEGYSGPAESEQGRMDRQYKLHCTVLRAANTWVTLKSATISKRKKCFSFKRAPLTLCGGISFIEFRRKCVCNSLAFAPCATYNIHVLCCPLGNAPFYGDKQN